MSKAIGGRRWKRRLGIAAGILAALVLIAVLAVWFWWDLPRRKVESALAARLSADVAVGALSMDGLSHFIVKDLIIRHMAGQPRIDSMRIATLDVTGSLAEIQNGRFTTLRAEGAVVRLVPPDPSIPPAQGAGVSATVERLTLDGARFLLGSGPEAAPGGDPAIVVSGTLDRVGGDLAGTLTLTAETLPVGSLMALAGRATGKPAATGSGAAVSGRLERLEGRVTIAEGGRTIDADARAARLVVPSAGGTVDLPSPSVEVRVRRERDDGPYQVEVRPVISFAESLSASAAVDPGSFEILTLEANARGVDVAPVLALVGTLPQGWKAAGRADLTVKGSAPTFDGALDARLTSVEGAVEGGAIRASAMTLKMNGAFSSRIGTAISVDGALTIGALRGAVQGRAVPESLAPVEVALSGELGWGEATFFEGRATLTSPPLGRLRLEGRARTGPDNDLKWRWEQIDLERVAALAKGLGAGLPEGITAAGQGKAEGTLTGALVAPRVAGVMDLTELQLASRPVEASASADTGTSTSASASATASLADGRASVSFAWTGPSGTIDLPALQAQARVRAGGLDPFEATLDAAGRIDPFRGAVDISRATVEAKGLGRLQASGFARREAADSSARAARSARTPSAPASGVTPASAASSSAPSAPAPGVTPASAASTSAPSASPATSAPPPTPSLLDALRGSAAIHFDRVDLARLQTALRPLTGELATGYTVKGDAEGDASVSIAPGGAVAVAGKAAIRRTGFSSSDSAQALEGLDTTWDLTLGARLNDPGAPATLRATADVSGFQLLWGTLFIDGAKLTSRLDLAADLTRPVSAPSRAGARVEWTFPDGPRFAGTATAVSGAPLEWTLEGESRDLATTFERYVRAPLGDSIALFRKIEASGTARVEARGVWSASAPTVSGRVRLDKVRIAGTEKVAEVTGLDLDFPFDLAWDAPGVDGARRLRGSEREGSVRFAHLTVMGLDVPDSSTALLVRADTVELKEGLAVPLLDGVVGFEQLKLIDLLHPRRRLESAMHVASVSLARASRAFALPPLEGTADAYFPHVALSMDTLAVDGGGEVRVFGGTLKLGTISGEDILSRYPKLVFSVDFSGIDLAKLTHTFDFGGMTGIVQGYLHECELFRGVPTAFDARVETEERKGVSHTVNVKAIQNLTILGTGTRPSIFDRGIHRFFDEYTYSRIGIAMSLKDDVFVLRGLEHRGEQELFVKGRLPFPINVVNAQPGFPISFQDMLERVKNLDVTAATVQK